MESQAHDSGGAGARASGLLDEARRGESGQTMSEYAVILAVIVLVVLAALMFLSGAISDGLDRVASAIAE